MNIAAFALKNRTVMVVLTIVLTGAGLLSYGSLGQLEDPSFTIKEAMLITTYPGASPLEVEQEVSDVIEEAVQLMEQVKEITSTSKSGISYLRVEIDENYDSSEIPQIWDELRRKVNDAQKLLPPGAGPTVVNDDFGDVYGVFFALTGQGYSYAELKDYAETLKTELLLCENVAKIDLWGARQEVIYVEMDRARMAELGISPSKIFQTLANQNLVQQSGKAEVDGEYMRITPSGDFTSVELIADLLIGDSEHLVRLGDIAEIHRGYQEPVSNLMLYDGQPALGLGISTMDRGNVVVMGEAISKRLAELEPYRPVGMELHTIYYQSQMVTEAVSTFLVNLAEAVAIVVILLMLFMGWRTGLVIGFVLLLTILGTFLGMMLLGVDLQRISLGALILALGMLVDNAIVVADSFLIRRQRGEQPEEAALGSVKTAFWPLLGATAVAVLAFAAIGFSPGNVGEFCRSLFTVMALSLSLSWILAITVTPLLCIWFIRPPKPSKKNGKTGAPYDSAFYQIYRRMFAWCLRLRWLVIVVTILVLFASLLSFELIPKAFFPDSTQRRFMVNYWKPEGTHIDRTIEDLRKLEAHVRELDGVTGVTAIAGQGALRFMLMYSVGLPNSSFGQLIVSVEDYHEIDGLIEEISAFLREEFPDSEPFCQKVPVGPGLALKVEAQFRGPDIAVLQDLANQALDVMRANPEAKDLRTDWRQPVQVIRPIFSQNQARSVGVSRDALAQALQFNFNGVTVGQYREGSELIPIVTRLPEEERETLEGLDDVLVWSSTSESFVPIRQVITKVDRLWEAPIIKRQNRQRAIKARCNPKDGLAEPLRQKLIPGIEAIDLPQGYTMEWSGEYGDSSDAQDRIAQTFPICLLAMFLIVVLLFNSLKKPFIIFLILPLAIIGVTLGLLVTGLPFGFMSILGFLGLSGMMIKNAIVLIDQIDLDLAAGKTQLEAVMDSGVSRLRPVVMAAGTTILGMAPLITDAFYSSMAATIMGGLLVATFLTLFIVPVLYTLFFRVKTDQAVDLARRASG